MDNLPNKTKLPVPNESEPPTNQDDGIEETFIYGIKLYAVLFGLTLVGFLIMLDQTIMATAIPNISNTFHSVKDVGWYGSAFLLSTAGLQPLSGRLYQYYSSKYMFLGGLAIFEIGSLICGVAQSSIMLIVGRAVAGVGSAGLLTGMLTILAASVPLAKRPVYLGIMLGISFIGLALGPVLGGVLTQHASWRWCFFINLPLGAITLAILLFIKIPDPAAAASSTKTSLKHHLHRLDLPGFVAFTPAIIMFLLALNWGGTTFAWNSATIIGLQCGSAGALAFFIAIEKQRGDMAMLPLEMLRLKVVFCAAVTTLITNGANFLITYYLPIWFQAVKEASPTMGGVYYLPTVGAQILATVISGGLVTRIGYYTPFAIVGCALNAVGCGLLTTLQPTSPAAAWAGYQVIAGIARGLTVQPPTLAVQATLPKAQLAVGNAFIMFIQLLGGALFISFGQTLFSNQFGPALEHFAPEVDKDVVFAAGATGFRLVVREESVQGVVQAYNRALTRIFYLGAGATSISFVTSWGLGCTSVKTMKVLEAETVAFEGTLVLDYVGESDLVRQCSSTVL